MFARLGIGSLALVAVLALSGCGDDDSAAPAVDSTAPGSIADEPVETAGDDDADPAGGTAAEIPCSLGALPGSAVVRLCAIAVAPGGTRAQIVLTVDEPTTNAAANPADLSALEAGCANTIQEAGWAVPGSTHIDGSIGHLVTATLDVQGVDWPASSVLYTTFGAVFHWASAPNVNSPDDSVSLGCFEQLTFAGSGTAHLVGVTDSADYLGGIDHWVSFGEFGFGEADSSHTGVTFENCTVELSAHAEALNDLWLSPTEWGSGCTTGYMRSEYE